MGTTAELIWTSELTWEGMGPYNREFCSLLNEALREDAPDLVGLTAEVVHAVNELCVVRRTDPGVLTFPEDCETYRGGGFDDVHQGFFTVRFDHRGATDPRFRCQHVKSVKNSHVLGALTGEPRESEFLFAPYSVFTVLEVNWGYPHRIVIQAAADNKLEPEDLPLAPWG